MSAARPTINISGRRIAIDLPHLAFATAIAGWSAWFFRDAWRSAPDIENLILIAPAATAAIILYGFVAAGCFQFVAGDAELEPLRPPLAASITIKIAGSMALLAAFVIAGPLIGFDIASFVYIFTMMLFLGERRILVLLLVPLIFCIAAIYCFNAILSTPLPLFFFSGDAS
jgi:hypothetical protein